MSLVQYPDAVNLPALQIWNNAAFDNGVAAETLGFDSSKENRSVCNKSPSLVKSPLPIKPLHPNGAIENPQQGKPLKLLFKQGLVVPPSSTTSSSGGNEQFRDEGEISAEIEEIRAEINRLSSRLSSLRLEKAEARARSMEIQEKAEIAENHKQNLKNQTPSKAVQGTTTPSLSAARSKIRQRGVTLGPTEIISFGMRSLQKGKLEKTPIQSTAQDRRKSCFWKLQEIDELKVTKQRGGRSSSISPKSRQSVTKNQVPRQGFTSIGSKKFEKKTNGAISSIQPKNLFKEEEKSLTAKKPTTKGRVVASRYSIIPVQSNGNPTPAELRKRSLTGNEKKSASFTRRSNESDHIQVLKNHTKTSSEIRNEAMCDHNNMEEDTTIPPLLVSNTEDLLPRIRTVRCTNNSPRDSGRAKRVAELVGRKSYFCPDEKASGNPVCQSLSFDDDEEEE